MKTSALISLVTANGQDFEFYPTTDEIIDAMVADIKRPAEEYSRRDPDSVLDVGAGNGKVLIALRDRAGFRSLHAIEKSMTLCEQLAPEILIVGTDFAEQSLLSKHVDIVFCNPPYSEFEAWAVKIIRQSASKEIYLVLPRRWESSTVIADALRYRDTECVIVGEFDFEDAEDRRARAKVHLLRIALRDPRDGDDAFDRFFKEEFSHLIKKFSDEKEPEGERKAENKFSSLVVGPSYVESLVSLYDCEILKIQNNFHLVSQLDAGLLKEFHIKPDTIMDCLKTRLSGLRSEYWQELFAHLDTVTNRLTSGSRRRLLDVLHRHVHVDFTQSNIYAVMIWIIKNSNIYIESQLIETYELMVDKCNVQLYKSNKKTWQDDRWRYRDDAPKNSHYALDYRIVTHRIGGVKGNGSFSFERGLDERAGDFLGDLLTLARNLGFNCLTNPAMLNRSGREHWTSGKVVEFYGHDKSGRDVTLIEVRAYLNGNLHLRLAKPFILALNVEHGRLKGWLHSREEAVEELGDAEAAKYYNTNMLLGSNPVLLLAGPPEETVEQAAKPSKLETALKAPAEMTPGQKAAWTRKQRKLSEGVAA